MARLGVPVSGRVKKLRAVEDPSAPIPKRGSKRSQKNKWGSQTILLAR